MTKKLNILMCCHLTLNAKLGGAKVYIETAQTYRSLGHTVDLFGQDEISPNKISYGEGEKLEKFPAELKEFIASKIHNYDIIEYEYLYLPYPRESFPLNKLLVARSTLLVHHLPRVSFPKKVSLRSIISKVLRPNNDKKYQEVRINQAEATLKQADCINVPNYSDKDILVSYGHDKEKIIVSPYGKFTTTTSDKSRVSKNTIAFIGSFDQRKGYLDIPKIFSKVLTLHPNSELLLIGAKGLLSTEDQVLSFFPKVQHGKIKVLMQFDGEKINEILKGVKIGIFPSYLESFGFGLIELYHSSIPTVSYKVPGPDMLSPESLLVLSGDWKDMADKCINLLSDKDFYTKSQHEVVEVANKFQWETKTRDSLIKYQELITLKAPSLT